MKYFESIASNSNQAYLVLNSYPKKKFMEVQVVNPKPSNRLSKYKAMVLTKKQELLIVDKWKLMDKKNYDADLMMTGDERKNVIVDEMYKNLLIDKGVDLWPVRDGRDFAHKDQLVD